MYTAARLAALILASAPLATALAQSADSAVATQLSDQEQRIKTLERKLETATKTTTVVKAGTSGFSIGSADGRNTLKLRGLLNVDGRYFQDYDSSFATSYAAADTWLLRKVRPSFEGTLDGIYDYRLQPDFGSGKTIILDAYVTAKFKPWLNVTVGKGKAPVGLERLQSSQYNRFVELGFPTSLLPNRDVGVQLTGAANHGAISYALAYLDGVNDGGSTDSNPTADADADGHREGAARLFLQPFVNTDNRYLRGLGFGIAGTNGSKFGKASSTSTGTNTATTAVVTTVTTSTLLPGLRSPAQVSWFSYRGDTAATTTINEATYANGRHSRWSPQAYYYYGSLGLLAEYAQSNQAVRRVTADSDRSATLSNKAWQISTSFLLTGESESYGAVVPNSNFAIGGPGIGAWEVAARYQQLDIDDAAFAGGSASFADPSRAASAASAYGIALNWYLNQNLHWTLEYDRTRFTGGAGSALLIADRKDESAFLTRFWLYF